MSTPKYTIANGGLEGLYKQTQEQLHRNYYNHPQVYVHYEQSDEERAEQSYWDAVGRGAVTDAQAAPTRKGNGWGWLDEKRAKIYKP
jgi:hypothetical protein